MDQYLKHTNLKNDKEDKFIFKKQERSVIDFTRRKVNLLTHCKCSNISQEQRSIATGLATLRPAICAKVCLAPSRRKTINVS